MFFISCFYVVLIDYEGAFRHSIYEINVVRIFLFTSINNGNEKIPMIICIVKTSNLIFNVV